MKKTKRALMIYPEFPINSYWNFRHLHDLLLPKNRFGYPKSNQPPLGLLCIAPMLSEYYGRDNVRLIDMNVQPLTDADLDWADHIYTSAMLTQSESLAEVAQRAKKRGKTVIGGGPAMSADMPDFDYIFMNESEKVLQKFLDEFLFGGTPAKIQRGGRPEAHEFFRPDYSFIEPKHYASIPVQFSRGCPHDCEFCDITVRYGRAMRTRELDSFFADLDQLYSLGWHGQVFIIDDNFIGKPAAALELLKRLEPWQKERKYPFEFFTQASVTLAEEKYEELLKAFAPAGFSMIFLGIETPNEASLKETNKMQNVRGTLSLPEKIHRIQEVGQMLILGGFIVGFDSDGKDIFDSQINFIEKIRVPTPMVGLLHPLPHTRLDARLKSEGRLSQAEEATGSVAGGLEIIYQPKLLTKEELHDGYIRILSKVYLDMSGFYGRCLASLKYIAAPPFSGAIKKEDVIGIMRLLREEGFKGNYRWQFWRYILSALFFHRRKVPYALRWAAYGLHFNRQTKRMFAEEGIQDRPAA